MAKISREITIDFFRPLVTKGSFLDALNRISLLPNDGEERNVLSLSNHPVRMQNLQKNGYIWQGEIIQIRMTDLPKKVRLRGESEDLGLEDDQGLGQGIVFSYHQHTDVILVQRNKFAVSASSLERYFTLKGMVGVVEFQPVFTKDALVKFLGMSEVKSVSLKLAKVSRGELVKETDIGLSELGRVKDILDAPSIEIKASIGSYKSSLNKGSIEGIFGGLLRWAVRNNQQDALKAMKVRGRVEEELITINLLSETMQEVISVQSDDRRRVLTVEERWHALLEAWEARQTELLELLQDDNKRKATGDEKTQ